MLIGLMVLTLGMLVAGLRATKHVYIEDELAGAL